MTDHCSTSPCSKESSFSWQKEWEVLLIALVIYAGGFLPFPSWIKNILFLFSYLIAGGKVLRTSVLNFFHGKIFDENLLMSIASIGAFMIGEYPEGAAVMIFYQIGEHLQESATDKSRNRIRALMDLRPDTIRILTSSGERTVSPQAVQIGQTFRVRPGERIGLDGEVINGSGFLDMSSLTGESKPVSIHQGQTVMAGSICLNNSLDIRAQKDYQNSTLSKIIELTEHTAQKKSKAESFITRFARIYTPTVVSMAILIVLLPPLLFPATSLKEWVYRALIFLVISCPCALVLSVPLGFFGGIGGAARRGILIKGSTYLEQLAHIYMLVFDKTGTLTQGTFEVLSIHAAEGYSKEDVLSFAASLEQFSNHPIASAILKHYGKIPHTSPTPTEIPGEGLQLDNCLAGNTRLLQRLGIKPLFNSPNTHVHLVKNSIYLGMIELGDRLKPNTQTSIKQLQPLVHKIALLSGDCHSQTQQIAQELSIPLVYADLLPAEKVETLEKLIHKMPKGTITAFVGDGINDAPVLTRADVGIAMGALGSDAAIEAADVVLMTDDIGKIVTAIEISRNTLRITKQNILLALGVKAAVLLLGIFGFANMWGAVFADVGVSLLAVLNSLRTLYHKK